MFTKVTQRQLNKCFNKKFKWSFYLCQW